MFHDTRNNLKIIDLFSIHVINKKLACMSDNAQIVRAVYIIIHAYQTYTILTYSHNSVCIAFVCILLSYQDILLIKTHHKEMPFTNNFRMLINIQQEK